MINKICENCHKMFLAKGWRYKTCSRKCDAELRNKKKFINNIHCCDNCERIFSNIRIHKNKFCSVKCSSEYDTLNRFGYGSEKPKIKICTNCKKEKKANLEFFYKCNQSGRFGLRDKCKECMIKINLKNKQRRIKIGFPHWTTIKRRKDKAQEFGVKYETWVYCLKEKKIIASNKKQLNKLLRRLNKFNPKLIKRDTSYYKQHYQISDSDWLELKKDNPKRSTLIYRIRYRYDTEFNLKERIKNQLQRKKKKYPYLDNCIRQAVKNKTNSKYFEIVGYTCNQLKNHLEKQFTNDMNWKDFRNGKIHIDHIKPQSLFNLKDINDIKECWSLDNLQPLWAKDNIRKSNKYYDK